ncbi:lytic transglycosylase domain-containing protein [Microvenator marinus]|jgi:soluble lytic murein transglycosylase-like protein|nr:lytic transglycosylase domain-containing protein [Microvenator marinus]
MSKLIVLMLGLLLPCVAWADLYKYRGKDGEIIITTEKRSDLKLIEVISSGGSKGSTSKTSAAPGSKKAKNQEAAQRIAESSKSRSDNVILPVRERQSAYDDIIREAAEAYNVPFGFVKAVIRIESNFNPNAISHAGAMGLMQLMPRTAEAMNVRDPFDPRQNIFGGAKFLRILTDRYHGDINLILAAYNAGDAAVARYSGIPYPQTRGYVAAVYKWYLEYNAEEVEP